MNTIQKRVSAAVAVAFAAAFLALGAASSFGGQGGQSTVQAGNVVNHP
ncbi:hypothetical protein AB0G79_23240 [Streptomyces sp. NPDC020807]